LRDDCFLARVVWDPSGRAFLLAERITFRIIGSGCGVDQRTLAQFGEHRGSESVPGADHSTANHEHVEVEDVDQIRHQHSQGNAETMVDALGVFIPLNGEIVD